MQLGTRLDPRWWETVGDPVGLELEGGPCSSHHITDQSFFLTAGAKTSGLSRTLVMGRPARAVWRTVVVVHVRSAAGPWIGRGAVGVGQKMEEERCHLRFLAPCGSPMTGLAAQERPAC